MWGWVRGQRGWLAHSEVARCILSQRTQRSLVQPLYTVKQYVCEKTTINKTSFTPRGRRSTDFVFSCMY